MGANWIDTPKGTDGESRGMERRDRWLYSWMLGYTAAGAASLLIPLYALSLGGGPMIVGVLASTAAFAGVPGALVWGWVAATTGRRRIFVVIALVATAVLLAITPLIHGVWVLVGLNALLWFFLSAAAPVLTLLVLEGTPDTEWEQRIGILNAYQGYGWVAGFVLGAAWTSIGARVLGPAFARAGLFWTCGAVAAIAVPLAIAWLPREQTVSAFEVTGSPSLVARLTRGGGHYVRTVPFATTRLYWGLRGMHVQHRTVMDVLQHRYSATLWGYFLAAATFSAGFAVFWGPIPAFLGASFSDGAVYWLFLAANIGSAAGYSRSGKWAVRHGARRLQVRALAARAVLFPLVGVVVVITPLFVEFLVLLGLFVGIGVTWAVIAITATGLVSRMAGADLGVALGVYTAISGIGAGIGSIAGGWMAGAVGYMPVFVLAGATVLVSVIVVWTLDSTA